MTPDVATFTVVYHVATNLLPVIFVGLLWWEVRLLRKWHD